MNILLAHLATTGSVLVSLLAAPVAGPMEGDGLAAAPATSAPWPGPVAGRPSTAPSGGVVWPLAPRPEVVAGFDAPTSRWGPGHRGVDLLGSPGQPVRAARAGRISYAGMLAGRGVVSITHGDTRTTYEPVSADVAVGDRVTAGQRIGRLQRVGGHCPPAACLHWGLLEDDTYLDPLTLVGAGPVRLLPWLTPGGAPGGTPAAGGPW